MPHSIPGTAVEVPVPRGAVMREVGGFGWRGHQEDFLFSLRGAVMKSSCLVHSETLLNLHWRRRQEVPQAGKWYVRREDGSC